MPPRQLLRTRLRTPFARACVSALLLTSPLISGCASHGPAVPQPFPSPGGGTARRTPAGRSAPDATTPETADPVAANPGSPGTTTTGGNGSPTATGTDAASRPIAGSTITALGVSPISASFLIQSVLSTAVHFVGTPYRLGGSSPSDGFDCSGFVYYVFAQQGVLVPRTVADQAGAGQKVRDVQPGDLVFFRTHGRGPTHVGIALGPDRFVHAPNSRGEVRVEPLARRYWADRFLEARRLF
jgi:cell wall-associated NlpC family hydrolase